MNPYTPKTYIECISIVLFLIVTCPEVEPLIPVQFSLAYFLQFTDVLCHIIMARIVFIQNSYVGARKKAL